MHRHVWPRSKYETEIQALCRFYIQFNHVYTFECVFAWSYAHIDIHNGFWYRCRLCLAVSMAFHFFPKEPEKRRSQWQQLMWPIVREQWPWMQAELMDIIMMIIRKRLWWIKTMIIFRLFPDCHLYIYIYTKYMGVVQKVLVLRVVFDDLWYAKMTFGES